MQRSKTLKKILYVCNTAGIAARFRLPVLKGALANGYIVECICGDGIDAAAHFETLSSTGVTVHRLPGLEADGLSLGQLWAQSKAIGEIVEGTRPDIVHAFTHRANVASYLALRKRPKIRFIPNVTGAGRLFEEGASSMTRAKRAAMLGFYRAMSTRCEVIYFQNAADAQEIGGSMNISPERIRLTSGSGLDPGSVEAVSDVDVAEMRIALERDHGIDPNRRLFVLPSRSLHSKGVAEFYAAAARYLDLFDDCAFLHAGETVEGVLAGFDAATLGRMQRPGLAFLGFRTDIITVMASAFGVVLPSYYREGTPRALIEGLYLGKMIVTTDMPGCRETVIDGWNGHMLSPRSADALLAAFVAARDADVKRIEANSRHLFERKYHADRIVGAYLAQYDNPYVQSG